jgi:Polyketide cyclase / dehydrase and lipid transport
MAARGSHKLKEVPGVFARAKSIVIQAPSAEVYAYVADIPRHPEWACEPMKIEGLPSSSGGAARFSSTVHLMGITNHGEIHVIAEEPPHRFVYECTDTAGHYRWTMTLRAVGTGTELTQSAERLEGPLWVRVIQPWLLWPLSGRRSVVKGLANIKARLEA